MKSVLRLLILLISFALTMLGVNAGAQGKPEKEKIRIGYAARATYLLFKGRIDELNVEFHPKSAKEELKEELEDLEHRQTAETAVAAETGAHTGAPK